MSAHTSTTPPVKAEQPGLLASVVLPTHGRRASLLRVLRALGRQSVPGGTFEVVVVCDGDIDGSAAACRTLAPELPYSLRAIEQENGGPAAARNRGVAEARAPLIVFVDDDVVPDESLIAMHLSAHEGQQERVTIGPLLPPPDVRLNAWGAWEERALCRQYDAMTAGLWRATFRQFYTGNAAVLKRHILEAGGFDPSYRRAEDVELALRLRDRGLSFVFLPEARGWHYVNRGFASWIRMPLAYGEADVAMARAGRPEVLELAALDYRGRNRPTRAIVPLCAGRPTVERAAVTLLGLGARGAHAAHLTPAAHMACSLIFNLRYFHGMVCALGGRAVFHRLIHDRDRTAALQDLTRPKTAPPQWSV